MRSILMAFFAIFLHCSAAAFTSDNLHPQKLKPTLIDDSDEDAGPPSVTPSTPPSAVASRHPLSTIRHEANKMAICTDDSATSCRVFAMPSVIGNIERYIHGAFVSYEAAETSWVALTKSRASMCYLARFDQRVVCVPVGAEVPANTSIKYRHPGSDHYYFEFEPQIGIGDRQSYYRSVRRFSRALAEAAAALNTKALQTVNSNGGNISTRPALVASESEFVDASEETWAHLGVGAVWSPPVIDANEGWGWGHAREPEPSADDDFMPGGDYVFAEPLEYSPPEPSWYENATAYPSTTRCVVVGITIVCTGQRPPPLVDPYDPPPAPQEPVYHFNWRGALCDATFGLFCSASEEQNRLDIEGKKQICDQILNETEEGCHRRKMDTRMRRACLEDAVREYGDCLAAAGR